MKRRSLRSSSRQARFRAAVKTLAFCGVAAVGLSSTARANTEDLWIGTTGDFNDPTQWSLGRVPVSPAPDGSGDDNADVFNGGTVNIVAGDTLMPNDVNAGGTNNGTTGDGTYNQTGGSVSVGTGGGWFRLGTLSGTTGTYNLSGGSLTFGTNAGAQMNVGEVLGGTGVVSISGGTMTLNNFSRANIGNAGGNGTLNLSGGSFLSPGNAHVAIGDGNSGDATGDVGTVGTFNLSGTGTFDINGELWIGEFINASGTLNMTGGTLNMHDWLAVGRQSAAGTINMSGGTINMDAANNPGSHITLAGVDQVQTGTINMTGGAINVATGGGAIWIGETATGIINMSGGTITANDGIVLGENGGNGTLNLNGAGGTTGTLPGGLGNEVVTTPTVTMGSDNANNTFTAATVNLNGGTLATNGFVEGAGTGTRTINFNGGTVQATADNTSFLGGNDIAAVVQAGGAIVDTNGHNVTIDSAMASGTAAGTADGGLTKRGAGMLTLVGLNSYTGPTLVSAGSLVVSNFIGANGAAGAVTVAPGATLSGNGFINLGAATVTNGGILAPGALPTAGNVGTLTVATTGTFTLAATSTLQFDITNAATKDLITASGARLALGGVLALNLGTGFDYTQTYTLFSGLTSESGAFSAITGTNTNRTPTLTFANGNLNLSFVAVPEPSTWAMGVFGLGMAAVWLRRRQVAA